MLDRTPIAAFPRRQIKATIPKRRSQLVAMMCDRAIADTPGIAPSAHLEFA